LTFRAPAVRVDAVIDTAEVVDALVLIVLPLLRQRNHPGDDR